MLAKIQPRFLHLLDVSLRPGTYSRHKLDQGAAEISQRVLDTRGNALMEIKGRYPKPESKLGRRLQAKLIGRLRASPISSS
jgi:hypothetical protein